MKKMMLGQYSWKSVILMEGVRAQSTFGLKRNTAPIDNIANVEQASKNFNGLMRLFAAKNTIVKVAK